MPSNIELKAYRTTSDEAVESAKSFGAEYSVTMNQTDTYFKVDGLKLKLREIEGKESELIYYKRDGEDRWQSDYTIAKITDTANLKQILKNLFGILVEVRKKRILYLFKNARIHIDEVENLGSFIEFEVVIHESADEASDLLKKLRDHFKIEDSLVLKESYSDLLLKKGL